jgi:hypothetical protein
MPIPNPEPGLVISYAYLWHDEHHAGREEGKDRPSVNAGEKMHRQAGVKMHHGTDGPRMRGARSSSVTPNSAFQFDR